MKYLFSLLLSIGNTALRGLLIKTFWVWFVLSQFPTLPVIGTVAAIGLSLFVGAISPWKSLTQREYEDIKDQDSDDRASLSIINNFAYTLAVLIVLGTGWIVHSLM